MMQNCGARLVTDQLGGNTMAGFAVKNCPGTGQAPANLTLYRGLSEAG